MADSKRTAARLVGLAVHSLVSDAMKLAIARLGRDVATGGLGERFDLALKLAHERGFDGLRARDAALAALLQDHTSRIGQLLLAAALEAVGAPPAPPSAPDLSAAIETSNGTPSKVTL